MLLRNLPAAMQEFMELLYPVDSQWVERSDYAGFV